MTRLLLIGLLTVLSFSSFAEFNENPIPPHFPPKVSQVTLHECKVWGSYYDSSVGDCLKSVTDAFFSWQQSLYSPRPVRNPICNVLPHDIANYNGQFKCIIDYPAGMDSYGNVTAWGTTPINYFGAIRPQPPKNTETCPPDSHPDYTIGPNPIDPANPNSAKACFPKFQPCPLGFFAKAVLNSSGGAPQCVPINCPSKGAQSNSVANWNGMLKVNDTGIYCDGRCAYQLDSVLYTGASFVTGTSLGLICGQGNPNDAKLTPKDSESTCETHQLSSGGSFIACDGKNEIPEPDTGEGDLKPAADTAKVDPNQKPSKYQGADCTNSADKMTCVGTDIVKALDHQTEQNKLQSDEKHNKNILFQLAINEYLEKNNRERANRLSSDMQNQTQQFVYGINSVTNAINQNGGTGGSVGLGKDELDDSLDKLVETFDGDSVIAQLASFLDEKNSQLDSANNELESKLNEGLSKFNDTDAVWQPFKRIPDMLPAEYSCQPFILSIDAHPLTLDFCEYEDLIKRVIGFVFILLTALRLFYQAQVIIRNAAIGSA